ncbi:MAG: hypothetical protein DME27_01755 [Verrucomicrobia bacterium]|nr:MAG: hypothetical protein DME27_01755 [Verrucomicrobiota bacterium]
MKIRVWRTFAHEESETTHPDSLHNAEDLSAASPNAKDDGPVVVDLPPAANGSSFLGTIIDAWQVPLTDVGFEDKGGKYLVLPPDYTGEVPAGYIPVRPKTYNTMIGIRSILASNSEEDERKGQRAGEADQNLSIGQGR